MVTVEGSLVVLAVGLLVGGLAVYLGALFALSSRSYTHAVVTAGLGAVAWWLLDLTLGELGVASGSLASLLGLVVWVAVLRWRYDAGWLRAALIGGLAWLAALVVLAVLADLGVTAVEPYGVPV
jgi:hypothetical protein